jgi:hypothetical protein
VQEIRWYKREHPQKIKRKFFLKNEMENSQGVIIRRRHWSDEE